MKHLLALSLKKSTEGGTGAEAVAIGLNVRKEEIGLVIAQEPQYNICWWTEIDRLGGGQSGTQRFQNRMLNVVVS